MLPMVAPPYGGSGKEARSLDGFRNSAGKLPHLETRPIRHEGP